MYDGSSLQVAGFDFFPNSTCGDDALSILATGIRVEWFSSYYDVFLSSFLAPALKDINGCTLHEDTVLSDHAIHHCYSPLV
ncbi:hypothetical protein CPB85DRAFT_877102 [Mucidula mucida]|nr:hypothetical protein CPB85DRAFT_877102 [Mucidula mucida]